MNTWTGPQTLPPPADVDEFGENTRGWLTGVQQEAAARPQPQPPVPVAAKGRRFHLSHRIPRSFARHKYWLSG